MVSHGAPKLKKEVHDAVLDDSTQRNQIKADS